MKYALSMHLLTAAMINGSDKKIYARQGVIESHHK